MCLGKEAPAGLAAQKSKHRLIRVLFPEIVQRGAKVGMEIMSGTRLGHKDLLKSKLTIIITSHRDLITSKAP